MSIPAMRRTGDSMSFRGLLGLAVLAALAFVPPAGAGQPAAFVLGDKLASKLARQMENSCKDGIGPGDGKRKSGWKQGLHLGKGDWAFVVDAGKLDCQYQSVCGTGGCDLSVVAVIAGKPKTVFKGQAIGWKLLQPAGAAAYLQLNRHGGECGKPGNAACVQILDPATGKLAPAR